MINLDELRAQVELLRWAKERKAELKVIEDNARDAVEAALGDHDVGSLDGEPVVMWRFTKRTALDQKLLKELFPDVFEECKRTTEVRRFEVLEPDA
jgi:predicted phage-related endonuclease